MPCKDAGIDLFEGEGQEKKACEWNRDVHELRSHIEGWLYCAMRLYFILATEFKLCTFAKDEI